MRIHQLEARIRELELAEQRFRLLLESAPDAIVIVDSMGRIAIVNAQTEKIFGYSRDELSANRLKSWYPSGFAASPAITSGISVDPHTRGWAPASSCSDCGATAANFRRDRLSRMLAAAVDFPPVATLPS